MKATIRNNVLPIGHYQVDFEGIEVCESDDYGPGWKWSFIVAEGEFEGRSVSRFTSDLPTPKNSCGRFLAGLAGKSPFDGLDVDTDDFLGARYIAVVEATSSGKSSRVGSIVPAADGETRRTTADAAKSSPVLPAWAIGPADVNRQLDEAAEEQRVAETGSAAPF